MTTTRRPRRSYVLGPKTTAQRSQAKRSRMQQAAEKVGMQSITDLVNLILRDEEFAATLRDAVKTRQIS